MGDFQMPTNHGVNLVPPAALAVRARRRTRLVAEVAVGGCLVGLALGYLALIGVRGGAEAALTEAQAKRDQVAAQIEAHAEVLATEKELTRTQLALASAMVYEVGWVRLVTQLQDTLPEGAVITDLSAVTTAAGLELPEPVNLLAPQGIGEVTLTARIATLPDVAAWTDALAEVPGLSEVTPEVAILEAEEGGSYQVTFVIQLNLDALDNPFANPPADHPSGEGET
jgi:Tfp pilus assembly protein PilN